MDNQEFWVPIKGFENYYLINNFGDILSLRAGKKLKYRVRSENRYPFTTIYSDTVRKSIDLHCLLATAFIPNPENKKYINHIDGDKNNLCLQNLEWVTPSENSRHSISKGLKKIKTTYDQVEQAKKMSSQGFSNPKIAKELNLSTSYIQKLVNQKDYSYFPKTKQNEK